MSIIYTLLNRSIYVYERTVQYDVVANSRIRNCQYWRHRQLTTTTILNFYVSIYVFVYEGITCQEHDKRIYDESYSSVRLKISLTECCSK